MPPMAVGNGVASHVLRSGSVHPHGRDNAVGVVFWASSLIF